MKKLLTLLFLSMAYMGGVLAQITLDGSETIMTQDELRATVTDGSHFGITAVSNTNDATNHKFYNGSGSMSNELTKNYLCTLVSNGTTGQYYLKTGDGTYFKTGNSGSNISKTENQSEAQAFTITTGASNDATENYSDQEANWIRFTCAGQNYWLNCQTGGGKYNQGPGGWTAFGIIGPFHLCTLNITKDGSTTTSTDKVVKRGAYTDIPEGYELKTPITIDHDGEYNITLVEKNNAVNLTYSYKYNGVEKYTKAIVAYEGESFPNPAIQDVLDAMPFGITIGAAPTGEVSAEDEGTTKDITLSANLPFSFYSNYGDVTTWYALRGHSNNHHYVYNNNGTLTISTSNGARENTYNYAWAFVGDPFNGFKIINRGATKANGGTPTMLSDANPCTFTTDENIVKLGRSDETGNGYFTIYKNGTGNNKYYNVRTNNLNIQRWGDADAGSTYEVAEITLFTEDLNNLQSYITSALANINAGKVGYPDKDAAANLTALTNLNNYQTVTADNYNQALAAYNAILYSNAINLPKSGHMYVLTNIATDGSKHNLYESASNNKILWSAYDRLSADGDKAKFICREVDGGYVFVNAATGHYLIWRGTGGSSTNTTGYTETYSANNKFTVKRATYNATNTNSASGQADLFGWVCIGGYRDASHTSVCFLYSTNGGSENFQQDSNDNVHRYGNGHSSMFAIEECAEVVGSETISNPNQIKLSSPNNGGTGSLDGKCIGTFSAPYAVELPQDVTAYTADYDAARNVVVFNELGTTVPANTGVLLYAGEGEFTVKEAAVPATASVSLEGHNNCFRPTGANGVTVGVGVNAYILSYKEGKGVKFYVLSDEDRTIARNKAYLDLTSANVSAFVFDFEDSTTGIQQIDTTRRSNTTYDLSGRNVKASQRGLYIIGGKKVIR